MWSTTSGPDQSLGGVEVWLPQLVRAEGQRVKTRGYPLEEAPFPDRLLVDAAAIGQQAAVAAGEGERISAGEQLRAPVAQGDAEVIRGVPDEPVWVDKGETRLGALPRPEHLESVRGCRIAVYDGAEVRVERGRPPSGEQQSPCQDALGAASPKVVPQLGDHLVERAGLVLR